MEVQVDFGNEVDFYVHNTPQTELAYIDTLEGLEPKTTYDDTNKIRKVTVLIGSIPITFFA